MKTDPVIPSLALGRREAAKAIGIGVRLLDDLIRKNEVPFVRLGARVVFPVRELQDWLSKRITE